MAQDKSLVANHVEKEVELLGRQPHLGAADAHPAYLQVDVEIADIKLGAGLIDAPSAHGCGP